MSASSIFLSPDELCARLGVPGLKELVEPCPTTHKHDCTSPATRPIVPPRLPSYKVDVARLYALAQSLWSSDVSSPDPKLVFPPPPDLTPETNPDIVAKRLEEWVKKTTTIDWEKHVTFLKGVVECYGKIGEDGNVVRVKKKVKEKAAPKRRGAIMEGDDAVREVYKVKEKKEEEETSAATRKAAATAPAALTTTDISRSSKSKSAPEKRQEMPQPLKALVKSPWMDRKSAAMIVEPGRDSVDDTRQREAAVRAWHLRIAQRRAAQERLLAPKTPGRGMFASAPATPWKGDKEEEDPDEVKYTGRRSRQREMPTTRGKSLWLSDDELLPAIHNEKPRTAAPALHLPSLLPTRRRVSFTPGIAMIEEEPNRPRHSHPQHRHSIYPNTTTRLSTERSLPHQQPQPPPQTTQPLRRGALSDPAPDELLTILRKPPPSRTHRDIERIFASLRPLKAFAKLSDFILTQLCGVFHFHSYEASRVVFRQGERGTSWFVIFSGRVEVRIAPTPVAVEGQKREEEGDGEEMTSREGSAMASKVLSESKFVVELGEGEGFGELALVNDAPRAATILTVTECRMLRIEKADYDRVLRFIHGKEKEEKVLFLKKVPILVGLDNFDLGGIANVTHWRVHPKGSFLIQQGDPMKEVCIIRKGTCTAFAWLVLSEPEYLDFLERKLIRPRPPDESCVHSHGQTQHSGPTYRILVPLGDIGPGHYFGEEIVLQKSREALVATASTPSSNNLTNTTTTTQPLPLTTPKPSSSSSDESLIRSKITLKCNMDVELAVLRAHDARWRLRHCLKQSNLTQRASDRDEIMNTFLMLRDRERWEKFKERMMDGVVRELAGDSTMSRGRFMSEERMVREVPFRF
ncbi:Rap guanine nucleotide exchange factor 4 [Rhizophlyctis rosea]|nr:Rap guanine nucleotide exchange factor 4 [Rhizophlyctis rosea]